MLGLKLHKHYEILGERVKWIILDIFHESYILLTVFCCVFLSEQHLNFSVIIFSILSSALLKKEKNAFLRNHHCELAFAI